MEENIKSDKELFTPLTAEEKKVDSVVRPSVGYWKDAVSYTHLQLWLWSNALI